jgi:uncharacterized protein YbaR (Trm112 family)
MRGLIKILIRVGVLVGIAAVIIRSLDLYKGTPEGVGEDGFKFSDTPDDDPYAVDEATLGGEVSPELLERLVCPLDKGPLELVDGKWLVNPRNGYRYPITDGIPVMLVEVGERYRDPALVAQPAMTTNGKGADL